MLECDGAGQYTGSSLDPLCWSQRGGGGGGGEQGGDSVPGPGNFHTVTYLIGLSVVILVSPRGSKC